jgi:coenzyme F420-0:L-glutamate ligase / coenzyme F420-1:gamma-L-glutamate ligase
MTEPGRAPTDTELAFVANRRVGRLATANALGVPSVVPFCYALIEHGGKPVVVSSLDRKPKTRDVRDMQRVRNLAAQPRITLVVDDYNDDWERLAFVQFHGFAEIREPGDVGFDEAATALKQKYRQYAEMAIEDRPLIWIDRISANSWSWTGDLSTAAARPGDLPSLIRGRRSVRALLRDPVPRAVIERAISAAGWAPSPHGRQPWRFAVVESPERKLGLADAMSKSWAEQLRLDGQDESIVQIRLAKSRARLLNAPALVIVSLYLSDLDEYPDPDRQQAETTMAIQSTGAAIQNFLLSIYADGFDAGWMCAPLFCPEIVRDALGLAGDLIPHALLPVGKAAADPVRRPRRALNDLIVSWD